MNSTSTQEKTQSRKDRLRWWTLVVVSVTVLDGVSFAAPYTHRVVGIGGFLRYPA
jgi:hypothetical protein